MLADGPRHRCRLPVRLEVSGCRSGIGGSCFQKDFLNLVYLCASKGLDKNNMPRSGNALVGEMDTSFDQSQEFDKLIRLPGTPQRDRGWILPGGVGRCGRSACHISRLKW